MGWGCAKRKHGILLLRWGECHFQRRVTTWSELQAVSPGGACTGTAPTENCIRNVPRVLRMRGHGIRMCARFNNSPCQING
eukprot:scaffold25248_cov124-Isochrysis_galbana.AAC.1